MQLLNLVLQNAQYLLFEEILIYAPPTLDHLRLLKISYFLTYCLYYTVDEIIRQLNVHYVLNWRKIHFLDFRQKLAGVGVFGFF